MKYFVTEKERKEYGSSCFHEFQKGGWDERNPEFWKEDSVCIHDDIMCELAFGSLIQKVIPEYDPFGITMITRARWKKIVDAASEMGGDIAVLVDEADVWAQETFREYGLFTILGI